MPTASLVRPLRAAPLAASRDHFVDLLRALAICGVVLEHWLFPVLAYDRTSGQLAVGNALSTPGAWLTTWVGQVMPLVFFAGGVANATSWARRVGPRAGNGWLAERLRRLAWPVLPLAVVWLPLPYLLIILGVPEQPVEIAAHLAGQLLWFLAAYLIAVVATPLMARLHARAGWGAVAGLVAAAAMIDLARFTWAESIGYLNVGLVWLAVHQIGILYADGRLDRVTGRRAWLVALIGYGVTAALVALGPYPSSMVGLPGAAMSNVNPPTLALVTLAAGQLGLALALRSTLLRLAARPRPARAYAWLAPRAMTIYLWHMPALALVAGVTVVGGGISTPAPGSAQWWTAVPVWLAALGATLGLIVRRVGRYERPARRRGVPTTSSVVAATTLIGGGVLGVTVLGFGSGVWSLAAVVAVAGGIALTTGRPARVGLAPPQSGQAAPWEPTREIARLVA